MNRINILLLLAVIASALLLVHSRYDSRRFYTQLEKAKAQAREIAIESGRLQVEKRAQATPLRVESIARSQLQMRTATPAITQYVRDDRAGVAATAATPGPGGRP